MAWAISGALAMYFEAIAIAAELRDYPGGAKALAQSIYPTIEGMRIIRWPADRLDTLGGYLAYHNIVLFNFFLAIFAGIQGARLIRYLEETRGIEFYLATGLSRRRITLFRTGAYLIAQLIISLSLGIGTAIALASSHASNTRGAILTLLAGGIGVLPFFGLGFLISQFVRSARTASGITSIIIAALYILDNLSGKYSILRWIPFISPFHYINLSRPVIPGFTTDYWSWVEMIGAGVILIYGALILMYSRDIGAGRFSKKRRRKAKGTNSRVIPKTLVADILWRQRYGLIAWIFTTCIFIAVFISMLKGVVDIWKQFSFLQQFTSSGFGSTPEEQYLAMVYEVLPPFLAAFIITQSSKWTTDLLQGRVPLFLSLPFSWSGLIIRRVIAAIIAAELIIVGAILTSVIGSWIQNVPFFPYSIFRLFVLSTLFTFAFAAFSALLVAILHGRSSTHVVSVYIGASWLIGFMAPYLNWPTWIVRLSIFDAFGHPFVKWPDGLNIFLIVLLGVGGLFAAMKLAERTSKSL